MSALQLVLSSFWAWLGTLILLLVVGASAIAILQQLRTTATRSEASPQQRPHPLERTPSPMLHPSEYH